MFFHARSRYRYAFACAALCYEGNGKGGIRTYGSCLDIFLRSGRILVQNCAILRNALRMLNDRVTQCQQRCATLQKQAQKAFLEL